MSSELNEIDLDKYYKNAGFRPAIKFDPFEHPHNVRVDVILKDNAIHLLSNMVYERKTENVITEQNISSNKEKYIIQIIDSGYPAWFDLRCN